MLTDEEKQENRRHFEMAVANAKSILKPGDRLRVTKCPGTKRWITFARWDGIWIESKSGVNDYAARRVDRLNGEPIDFTLPPPCRPNAGTPKKADMKIVIIHGPQGSGKTLHAQKLMAHYGCRRVIEEYWPGQTRLKDGDLALTLLEPPFDVRGAIVVDIETAKREAGIT